MLDGQDLEQNLVNDRQATGLLFGESNSSKDPPIADEALVPGAEQNHASKDCPIYDQYDEEMISPGMPGVANKVADFVVQNQHLLDRKAMTNNLSFLDHENSENLAQHCVDRMDNSYSCQDPAHNTEPNKTQIEQTNEIQRKTPNENLKQK